MEPGLSEFCEYVNLLRRHNDFWRLYAIKSWLVMEMPNGRIYTYNSHPDVPAPTEQDCKSFLGVGGKHIMLILRLTERAAAAIHS